MSPPTFVWDSNLTLIHVTFDLNPCDLWPLGKYFPRNELLSSIFGQVRKWRRQKESDAYEPTLQNAPVGQKPNFEKIFLKHSIPSWKETELLAWEGDTQVTLYMVTLLQTKRALHLRVNLGRPPTLFKNGGQLWSVWKRMRWGRVLLAACQFVACHHRRTCGLILYCWHDANVIPWAKIER